MAGSGQGLPGLAALAEKKSDENLSRGAESTLFRFVSGHAFAGKYSQRSHAERTISSACERGFFPQTVNHVLFDCPCYDAARAGNPRFGFLTTKQADLLCDYMRYCGVQSERGRDLVFRDHKGCFKPRPFMLRDPG